MRYFPNKKNLKNHVPYKKLNAWESITPACKINSKQYYKYDLYKKILKK